jgi:gamma-glutamylcyclotransferase
MTAHFAYGSNMDLTRIEERLHRLPQATCVCLKGYRLLFNKRAETKAGIGWANIVERPDDVVHGILYELTKEELDTLDKYEKVKEGHYRHETVSVQISDGTTTTAIAYVARSEWVEDGLLPTREYLNHLLAARDYLPPDYVAALEKQQVRESK